MGSREPRVSIVIVDFKGQRFLTPLFDSLSTQIYSDFEIVLVDCEGSLELPSEFVNLRYRKISAGENLGFAGGCNLGVQEALGELIVFLNNDTVVDERWLDKLVHRVDSDLSISVVVSKVLFFPKYVSLKIDSPIFNPNEIGLSDDSRWLGVRLLFDHNWSRSTGVLRATGFHGREKIGDEEWRWAEGNAELWVPLNDGIGGSFEVVIDTPIELLGRDLKIKVGNQERNIVIDGGTHTLAFELIEEEVFDVVNSAGSSLTDKGVCEEIGIYEIDSYKHETACEVSAFSGCSVLVRKEVFEELSGFDKALFAYYEDTDLSWRIKKMGGRMFYEPKSIVRHHCSSTSLKQSAFFYFQIYRNMRWNVAKNAPFRIAVALFFREFCSGLTGTLVFDSEYSAKRLKRETLSGMLKYLLRRIFVPNQ